MIIILIDYVMIMVADSMEAVSSICLNFKLVVLVRIPSCYAVNSRDLEIQILRS